MAKSAGRWRRWRRRATVLAAFAKAGIDIDALAKKLQDEGAAVVREIVERPDGGIKSKSAAMRKAS